MSDVLGVHKMLTVARSLMVQRGTTQTVAGEITYLLLFQPLERAIRRLTSL